jgi:hypothetical protein
MRVWRRREPNARPLESTDTSEVRPARTAGSRYLRQVRLQAERVARSVYRSMLGSGTRELLISRIAVILLALGSSYYVLYTVSLIWQPSGYLGIEMDGATAIVSEVEAFNGSVGVLPGDRVDLAAMPFRERSYLYEQIARPAGMQIKIPLVRGGRSRVATFKIAEFHHTAEIMLFAWSRRIVALLFIVTGVILVWNRPSIMLWGLAVFLIRTHDYIYGPFVSPATAALLIFGYAFIYALGMPGLIVFAARFPDGRANRSTRFWEVVAAGIFLFYVVANSHDYIPLFTAHPIPAWPDFDYQTSALYVAIFVALCTKLRTKNRSTRAALACIVAGYAVGIIIGRVALRYLLTGLDVDSYWADFAQLVLMLALPASVAYSVIRHRSFGLGYLTNRTLVFASLTIAVASTFLIGVWATSTQLPSTFGVGTAMFVALLAGMTFQANRGRAILFVDRIFLPQRYEAGLTLDRIREKLRGTNDAKRVAGEVAETLGLASVAVFERTSDGGFVRNAANGWPDGTAWHLLPGDRLTRSLARGAAVVKLPDELSADCALPGAPARPRVALTIRRGGRVERAILVGPYRDGARLDRDAILSMHGVFDDALVV